MNYERVHHEIRKHTPYKIYEIILYFDVEVKCVDWIPRNKKSLLVENKYIYLLRTLTIEQKRYYLLHELAHLALHRYIADRLKNP